jgi:hypothetical protein
MVLFIGIEKIPVFIDQNYAIEKCVGKDYPPGNACTENGSPE